jgi:hypothetical protein
MKYLKSLFVVFFSVLMFYPIVAQEQQMTYIINNGQKKVIILAILLIVKIIIIVSIFGLGLVVASFQKQSIDTNVIAKKRIGTLWLGIIISILTFANTMFFKYDYTIALSSSRQANSCFENMKSNYLAYKDSEFEEKQFKESFNKESDLLVKVYNDFFSLIEGSGVVNKLDVGTLLFDKIYAQSNKPQKPDWLVKYPNDDKYIYVIGNTINESLEQGAINAKKDALEKVKGIFVNKLKDIIKDYSFRDMLAIELSSHLLIVDEYYNYEANTYSYWVLTKYNKNSTDDYVSVYLSKNEQYNIDMKTIVDSIIQ